MRKLLLIAFSGMLFFSCKEQIDCEQQPDVSSLDINVDIQRLDHQLFSLKSKEDIQSFLNKNPVFADYFVFKKDYEHDSILINQLHKLINDPYMDTLYNETQLIFQDIEFLKSDFERAFKNIKYYYPDFQPPVIQTVITGFGNDLYVSDTLVIVGLDFFLGEDSKYKPTTIPQYILKRYSNKSIVSSVVLLMSDKFNKTNLSDNTMLAEMLYYGKAYYFTKRMIPCIADSLLVGYSSDEIKGAHSNSATIWAHFIENQLLYETNHFQKQKYLAERPKTLDIGSDCPGRIGTWLGYEIVKKFNKETKINFLDLMKEANIQRILTQSKYKPKNS
jgi:gliding motility-associated lipoprotein GldB